MKPLVIAAVLLPGPAAIGGAATAPRAGIGLSGLPRFDGYVGTAAERFFVLAPLAPDGTPGRRSWLKIGQKMGELELAAFDGEKEEPTLKRTDGVEVVVRLAGSKGLESKAMVPNREAARAYALGVIDSFLKTVREEHPDRNVRVDPAIAMMPEDRRRRFLLNRAMLHESGQFLTPFLLPDGRWGEAISGDEAKKLPPSVREILTEEDRREINMAWALARTEALARSIPPRK